MVVVVVVVVNSSCSSNSSSSSSSSSSRRGACKASRASVRSNGFAKEEASPEPKGSLRRTALACSRCKEIAGLCQRRSVSAAGVSSERPAMRPPRARQTTAAVGPQPPPQASAIRGTNYYYY